MYDTTSRANPGNTSPELSDYTNVVDEGTLANGAYNSTITGLTASTTYYFRSFGYDDIEDLYVYGDELSFATLAPNYAIEGTVAKQGTATTGANVTLLKHQDSAGTAQDGFENEATNTVTPAGGAFSFDGLDGDRKYAVLSTWTDTGDRFRSNIKAFLDPTDKNKGGS